MKEGGAEGMSERGHPYTLPMSPTVVVQASLGFRVLWGIRK